MANVVKIEGIKQLVKNAGMYRRNFAFAIERGLKRGGLFLQRESQKLVPVNTGNLKASATTRAINSGLDTQVQVGYTAKYAIFVHEAVEMKLKGLPRGAAGKGKGYRGHYWDPRGKGQAKFLEQPAKEKRKEIRDIVVKAARAVKFTKIP